MAIVQHDIRTLERAFFSGDFALTRASMEKKIPIPKTDAV